MARIVARAASAITAIDVANARAAGTDVTPVHMDVNPRAVAGPPGGCSPSRTNFRRFSSICCIRSSANLAWRTSSRRFCDRPPTLATKGSRNSASRPCAC